MKLFRIHINNLFNLYSYNIDLISDQDPNLKILTGPNGYGKSTLFSCIYALYSVNLYYFFKIQFDFIRFTFENGDSIEIIQTIDSNQTKIDSTTDDQEHPLNKCLTIIQITNKESLKVELKETDVEREIEKSGYFRKNNGRLWLNSLSDPWEEDNEYTTDDIVRGNPSIFDSIIQGNGKSILLFLNSLEAYLIKDQRLLQTNQSEKQIESQKNKTSIVANSEDLSNKIKYCISHFARSIQQKESSLVDDLIASKTDILEKDDYFLRLEKLKSQINVLRNYEIIDISIPTWSDSYSDDTKKILSVWIKNYESNLEVFQDLLDRLNILCEIITTKDFANKTLKIKNGYEFVSPQKKSIDIASLSSGEQHLIVMLYELLFKAAKGTLVLIDEPEISLHVIWQLGFLDDIIKISQKRDLQIVVATHSPQIIGEKWDFTTDLFEANLQQ
jgi:predicted ATP-binding protein involved in virulence